MDTDRPTALPDGIALYLREIGQGPLLTAEQEVALAQRIAQGDTAAAEALATTNLRLVVSVARRYRNAGLPLDDLIAEGNLGLLRAVEKFDWRRGHRFSTYAVWWIRQSIVRALGNTGRAIRVPVYLQDALRRHEAAVAELTATLGRAPTDEEMAAHLGPHLTAETLALGQQMTGALASLDQTVDDSETPLGHFIPDTAQQPDERATQRLLSSEMRDLIQSRLTAREQAVIRARFGLDGGERQTLAEVAAMVGKTRERVRQIEVRALGKLRDALADADLRSA